MKNPRGVFERPKGSGVWWVRVYDEHGRIHRQKVGRKTLARDVYAKLKSEIKERRFFPQQKRDVLVAAFIKEYLSRVHRTLRDYRHVESIGKEFAEYFGTKTLREVVPGDLERFRARLLDSGRSPATCNRISPGFASPFLTSSSTLRPTISSAMSLSVTEEV